MGNLCVVHLVRRSNGIFPLRRFLESYRSLDAGIDHDLLILWKGFDRSIPNNYSSLLSGIPYRELLAGNSGFDIAPYNKAAREIDSVYFCFLNSFSVILDPGWLSKLYSHASREGVGLAGATGSWESVYSNFQRLAAENMRSPVVKWKWLRAPLDMKLLKYYEKRFPPFPNFHIRTNAFMMKRDLLLEIERSRLILKTHAHEFESGRKGLTRQILEKGLKPIVVGRDGAGYEKDNWNISGTFRQEEQANLLVADNQTMQYHRLPPEEREKLRFQTWGTASGTATRIGKSQT
jgi:hypothetical protein